MAFDTSQQTRGTKSGGKAKSVIEQHWMKKKRFTYSVLVSQYKYYADKPKIRWCIYASINWLITADANDLTIGFRSVHHFDDTWLLSNCFCLEQPD